MSALIVVIIIMEGSMEKVIPIKDIRPDNPDVVSAIVSHGYAVITQAYLERCISESVELAKLKAGVKRENGKAVWEDDV